MSRPVSKSQNPAAHLSGRFRQRCSSIPSRRTTSFRIPCPGTASGVSSISAPPAARPHADTCTLASRRPFDTARSPQASHQARSAALHRGQDFSVFLDGACQAEPFQPSRPVSAPLTSVAVCGLLPSRQIHRSVSRGHRPTPGISPLSVLPNQTPSPLQRVEPLELNMLIPGQSNGINFGDFIQVM